jgi:hypothetical protein
MWWLCSQLPFLIYIVMNRAQDDGMRRALLSSISGKKILKSGECVANLYFKLTIWAIQGQMVGALGRRYAHYYS